jgi:chromosome segregation ATPase
MTLCAARWTRTVVVVVVVVVQAEREVLETRLSESSTKVARLEQEAAEDKETWANEKRGFESRVSDGDGASAELEQLTSQQKEAELKWQAEKDALEGKLRDSTSACAALEEETQQSKAQRQEWQAETDALKVQLRDGDTASTQLQDANNQIKESKLQHDAELGRVQAKLVAADAKVATLDISLAEKVAALAATKETAVAHEGTIAALNQAAEEASNQQQAWAGERTAFVAKVEAVEAETAVGSASLLDL